MGRMTCLTCHWKWFNRSYYVLWIKLKMISLKIDNTSAATTDWVIVGEVGNKHQGEPDKYRLKRRTVRNNILPLLSTILISKCTNTRVFYIIFTLLLNINSADLSRILTLEVHLNYTQECLSNPLSQSSEVYSATHEVVASSCLFTVIKIENLALNMCRKYWFTYTKCVLCLYNRVVE